MQKLILFFVGMAIVTTLFVAATDQVITQPSRAEVCAIVNTMPSGQNTNELLFLLKTNRQQLISDLKNMKKNMQQYEAEGYGWQNVIDGTNALEPQPGSWLIGALKMACEF
jgi:hypothetical protein